MGSIDAKCLLCGKVYAVAEDHKDYPKLQVQEKSPTFICDLCSYRVRHESDEQTKPQKPIG